MTRTAVTQPWTEPSGVVADLLRLAILVSGVVVLLSGQLEGGLRFLGAFVLLLVPRRMAVPRPFDAAFAAGLLIAAWANAAHWYEAAWWVDDVIHSFLPGVTAAMLYLLLARTDVLPDLHDSTLVHRSFAVVLLTVALGLAVAALWEMYEWTAVTVFDQTSINVGYDDTILDMALGGAGSVLAGVLLRAWGLSGHGTRRPVGDGDRGRDDEPWGRQRETRSRASGSS